jgi:acyl-homoserine-lactone acylase
MRRILKYLASVIVLLMVVSMVWEPWFATSQVPPMPPAKPYDARIVRDQFGVPHVYGRTDADTAYGLAYAHAEDDFTTLQDVIAMTRGRLGLLRGAKGAPVDYVGHLLGARTTAENKYPSLPSDVRAMAEGYAAGLNRYAAAHPDEVRLKKLFPVSGEDIVTGFVLRSPFFFGLDNVIGALAENKEPPASTAKAMPATPIGEDPSMNGSNAFAVAPKRMADGKTWLISNAHQPYEGDVAWYEAAVHSGEGLDFVGATFPGSPFIFLGHNRNLGWTNTVNEPDLIDVYKLTLNPAGDMYKLDGKWQPLSKKRVWLAVKYGWFTIPVPKTVYRSVQGPVIINKNGAYAIRYAGIDQARMLEQYYRITKAQNWEDWSRAMDIRGIPATNFIYADKTGRIAYVYNAMFPPRQPGFDYTKVLPGDITRDMWSGAMSFDSMPKNVNPASGFLINGNNTPFMAAGPGSELDPRAYSPLLGIEQRVTNRTIRAIELMAADQSITPEELLAIKFDMQYTRDPRYFPKQWFDKLLAADLKDEPDLVAAQKLLATWDYASDGKGAADTLGEALMRAANLTNYHGDPLPDPRTELRKVVDILTKNYGRLDPPLLEVQRLRRGKVDLAMDGGTDTLRATTSWDKVDLARDGRGRVKHGDSFIMLINWDKAGRVSSQSIVPYGSATTRPNSPHYTDQMQMFVDHKFKPVPFERADVIAQAKRAYRVNP